MNLQCQNLLMSIMVVLLRMGPDLLALAHCCSISTTPTGSIIAAICWDECLMWRGCAVQEGGDPNMELSEIGVVTSSASPSNPTMKYVLEVPSSSCDFSNLTNMYNDGILGVLGDRTNSAMFTRCRSIIKISMGTATTGRRMSHMNTRIVEASQEAKQHPPGKLFDWVPTEHSLSMSAGGMVTLTWTETSWEHFDRTEGGDAGTEKVEQRRINVVWTKKGNLPVTVDESCQRWADNVMPISFSTTRTPVHESVSDEMDPMGVAIQALVQANHDLVLHLHQLESSHNDLQKRASITEAAHQQLVHPALMCLVTGSIQMKQASRSSI
ncbi:uncharacterized protein EV420DRAFT_1485613 [Desarmillaria tabescens]|uniref:DOMON domain-containing protein n=1 Tax=Armillaria tabescens TaxID=1929756 RepID=A0AA39MNS6_ARMTA|nr:uncharacterized protein EV420DRAFT_1485613 [Desarmillaria tabescens]KAK0441541.1 hypothetical protein EV420DRAFT_1485613 [Desarmillaria tabescens]